MAKNRQKMAKIIRKIDFLYNNFPKKVISLRKCTKKKKKKNRLRRKKSQFFFSRLRRDTAATPRMGGGAIPISGFWDSAIIPKPASLTARTADGVAAPTRCQAYARYHAVRGAIPSRGAVPSASHSLCCSGALRLRRTLPPRVGSKK